MISIIIPTYNRRPLLERALAGVFAQTRKDYEVIVVDDGSMDDTLDFLRSQPVAAIPTLHSGKPAIARNVGIAYAQGELVAFLDSDDVWEATALEELSAALDRAPGAGFAFCDYADSPFDMMPNGIESTFSGQSSAGIDIFSALLVSDFLATGSLLIRREAVEAIGKFDTRLWIADDWDYWLRLAAQFKAVHVGKPLVHVHAGADSISRASGGMIFADNKLISQKMAAWCQAHRPGDLPLARRVRRRCFYESARYQWHHGAYAETARDLITLLDYSV